MKIQYLERDEIDDQLWNSCVHYANNGNIFGYTWYLDNVARNWGGLVEDGYTSVFPLPFQSTVLKRKRLHQPQLMREMGLYTVNALSPVRFRKFLEAIPTDFIAGNLMLNEQNGVVKSLDYQVSTAQNSQLLLMDNYNKLVKKFSRERLLELEVAEQSMLQSIANKKPEVIADFFKKYGTYQNSKTNKHALLRVMYNALHRGWGVSSVTMNPGGKVLAANFYIYSQGKVLSLCPAESPAGRSVNALASNFNALIRSHAARKLVLDFNGPHGNAWATGFGATTNDYFNWELPAKGWIEKYIG